MLTTALLLALSALTPISTLAVDKSQHAILQTQDDDTSPGSMVRQVLLDNEIVPQVLDDFTPAYDLDIAYPSAGERVLLGNDISPKSVTSRPVFNIHPWKTLRAQEGEGYKRNSTFTLVLTDPDALSRAKPSKSEMCHWVLTNVTLDDTAPVLAEVFSNIFDFDDLEIDSDGDTDLDTCDHKHKKDKKHKKKKGKKSKDPGLKPVKGEVESYYPPSPPKKTGSHRYVFVLLEGPNNATLTEPKERAHWGYKKERHGVRDWAKENGLEIVGANFFFAKNKKQ